MIDSNALIQTLDRVRAFLDPANPQNDAASAHALMAQVDRDMAALRDTPPGVVVVVEGGMVNSVLGYSGLFAVIDYDVDGADEHDIVLIPQDNGSSAEAVLHLYEAERNPMIEQAAFDLTNRGPSS